jgi:hypothetical protein
MRLEAIIGRDIEQFVASSAGTSPLHLRKAVHDAIAQESLPPRAVSELKNVAVKYLEFLKWDAGRAKS